MIIVTPGEGRIAAEAVPFSLTINEVDVVIDESGPTGESTSRDVVFRNYTTGRIRKDAVIAIESNSFRAQSLSSSNPDLSTVTDDGYVETVATGAVGINARIGTTTRQVVHNGRFVGPVATSIFDRYDTDTLGSEIGESIASLIDSGRTDMSLMVDGQWNPNCWAASLDWSGVAVDRNGSALFGATPISPRHVLMATHTGVAKGSAFTYCTPGGAHIQRSMVDKIAIPGTDIEIGILASELPAAIAFYRLLPSNWQFYLSPNRQPHIVCTDRQRNAVLRNWWPNPLPNATSIGHAEAEKFSKPIISGDSGQPIFTTIEGGLVLLGSHYQQSSLGIGFSDTSQFIHEINAAMSTIGGGYQLTTVDLSSYTNYGPP